MRIFLLHQALVFLSFSANFLLSAQTSTGETFTVSGAVTNSVTGEPVKRAMVTLRPLSEGRTDSPKDLIPFQVLTDPAGSFSFTGLSAGTYRILCQKPQHRQGDVDLTLKLGPSKAKLELKLDPLATIEGTVLDTAGVPIQGASVQVTEVSVEEGRRKYRMQRSVSTDDRGRYRLWNLTPGSYYVRLAGRAGGTRAYMGENAPLVEWPAVVAPIYHGRAADRASATPLVLSWGQHVAVDFAEPLRPAFKIRGSLSNFVPHSKVNVELLTPDGELVSARVSVNEVNGRVEVNDVTAGNYRLRATQGDGDARLQAEADVRVTAGHVEGVQLSLQRGADLAVSLRTDKVGQTEDQLPCQARMVLQSAGTPTQQSIPAEGGLEFKNVPAGAYSWRVEGYGCYVASALMGSETLTAKSVIPVRAGLQPERIELALRSDGGGINVEVSPEIFTGSLGIIAVPDFESLSGPVVGLSPNLGRFFLGPVAPGDYLVYAHPKLTEIPYAEPEGLRSLTNGVRVSVTPNGSAEVKITAVSQ